LAQKNRRAWTRMRTGTPAQGRSANVRTYRLWTRSVGSPHSGQRTSVASEVARIVSPSSSRSSVSTRSDRGTGKRAGAAIGDNPPPTSEASKQRHRPERYGKEAPPG
jgi:hypothetical protein